MNFDCIVIGSGHAGFCAALSAHEHGCRHVLIVEKAPQQWSGGNGYFTAGAHRTVHGGLGDLLPLVHNVTSDSVSLIDIEPYTAEEFARDIMRLSDGRSDPGLVAALIDGSRDTIEWLARKIDVHFTLSFNRQAYQVEGRQKFWGGMALSVVDGGKGLIATHLHAVQSAGIEIWYETPALNLIVEENTVVGVLVRKNGETVSLRSYAVVLAAGGYESNRTLRSMHLGPEWSQARVRGTPFNTGDGIAMAHDIGAKLTGDWSGCHSTCWDALAPEDSGDRELSNQYTKSGYPLGIMINLRGKRFVDEGEDFRNYTYAKFGRAILDQPEGVAWQVFDAKVTKWLRVEEYGDDVAQKVTADNLDTLAGTLGYEGKDKEELLVTINKFNTAVRAYKTENPAAAFDPAIKDCLSTTSSKVSVTPPKSNWALAIDSHPFTAVKVACGITFTFGGVAIDPHTAGVISEKTHKPIKGLYCTGEMVGGLFYGNYPGGSGLTAGAVFGRKAGLEAARSSRGKLDPSRSKRGDPRC
ncbi:FAD/NAD(P)-binding domain-containing protein [Rickenella mellea]|uniref:FAD/NAD(P)-binding domain-containing protein n=1 Tax=Rickenella mellea TaxID=50990 RepID=A0A4Y7PQV4_9AGAM|nr:FAD/NAD(P)-binding domain-containing protein [Rickenella mellea]